MNMGLRGKNKKRTFFDSVYNCLAGISYTVSHENNFKREIVLGIIALLLGFFLRVSIFEWIIIILLIGLVLVSELINTAIEKVVDLYTLEYNEIAKHAKDVAGASVFVMCLFSLIVGIIIFLPKLISLF